MNAFILLLVFVTVSAANEIGQHRRFLSIKQCSEEEDCGKDKCCLFGKVCSPRLPKYSTCFLTDVHKCGCKDGLACRVTKEFTILGQEIKIRQCMPIEDKIAVEKVEEEEMKEMAEGDNEKRFLFNRCKSGAGCGDDKCCLFGRLCAPKLPKDATCYLRSAHKCGCSRGLECQVTTHITIPIIGVKIPLRQCVPSQ